MDLFLTIRVALRALAKNKMRASLTVLGVVIGIAAVTTMVSIGESAGGLLQNQLQSFGVNVLVVIPATGRSGGVREFAVPTLTVKDAHAIATECPAVLAQSPIVGASAQVIYRNVNYHPKDMAGVGVDYLTVRNWPLEAGDFFSDQDIASASRVCVIGRSVAVQLFQTGNPIGQKIQIKNIPFEVIGVLERKGANLVGQDQDDIVLMPHTTVKKRLQSANSSYDTVNAILISARTQEQMGEAEEQINQLMLERHRISPGDVPDFEIRSTNEVARVLAIVTGTITLLLSSIAGISLLVGGVGIMNIMLVSVTERTREIGIRMAVGARSGDILRQFLIEAVLLSGLGGVVGIILGVSASIGVTSLINHFSADAQWPVVVSIPAALIALVFACGVGLIFGYYPARRASRLDPIEALRYE
jgi:putative ABC transport system permease protein